jgi:hypothetical protein
MAHSFWVGFLTIGLFWTGVPGAQAASKYNACGLLTAAELQAAVHAGVDKSDDKDVILQAGPYKGETMSSCTWAMGASYVSLNVIRAPQTAEQKAAGLSGLRRVEAGLVQKGWTVQPGGIPGADCNSYKPPAGSTAQPFASCIMQSKGLAFWIGAGGATILTPPQVKSLGDKIAGRLP